MPDLAGPKYLRIAEELEAGIHDQRWHGGKLPGVRAIAEEHRVAPVTALRALQILRAKGLIQTVDRSGCYVTPPLPHVAERWALCMRLTPEPWQAATGSITSRGFQAVSDKLGFALETDAFNFHEDSSEREMLRQARAAVQSGIGGLFFLPSRLSEATCRQDELFLSACRVAGLPVVLIDRNLRDRNRPLEYDLVSVDDLAGGAACTEHLLTLGRKRIAFITGSPTSSHDDRMAGYLRTLHLNGNCNLPLILEQSGSLPAKGAVHDLTKRVRESKADAVVCYEDYVALALIIELLACGVRVPDDVAVTGFDDLPIGDSFAIGVTTYTYPAETIATHAVRLMRERINNPNEAPVKITVPGRLIIRESTVRR